MHRCASSLYIDRQLPSAPRFRFFRVVFAPARLPNAIEFAGMLGMRVIIPAMPHTLFLLRGSRPFGMGMIGPPTRLADAVKLAFMLSHGEPPKNRSSSSKHDCPALCEKPSKTTNPAIWRRIMV